jgi:hypothetical protein
MQNNCIINWELHQKIMAKKNTITVCTGIGANMFFPEYITIDIAPRSRLQSIFDDWLEANGLPENYAAVEMRLEKITKPKKNG